MGRIHSFHVVVRILFPALLGPLPGVFLEPKSKEAR